MCGVRELNFDGLVGPTHNYAGLSPGNLASERHAGKVASPRAAALQGLAKMRFLADLGVSQAVLPPAPRPDVATLRRLGFEGSDARVLEQAAAGDAHLLRAVSSASSMWTANAATVAPSSDTQDGRVHLTVANLSSMFHRSLEPRTTLSVLRRVFSDPRCFAVHEPLPAGEHFADEGAANHLRLATSTAPLHLFAWGRSGFDANPEPSSFPRRQTREASLAVARLNALSPPQVMTWQQHGHGIDAGAFHTDVLAASNDGFLMLHEHAFVHHRDLVIELKRRLGDDFRCVVAHETELPAKEAVSSYPFNSQIVTLPGGTMAIVAPAEASESGAARRFLDRVVAEDNAVSTVHYVDVNASMSNGGGPACLRLRVMLTRDEQAALGGRVVLDDTLYAELVAWVERRYRDRLRAEDLADPALLTEAREALDELTRILVLGSVYDFQTTPR